MFFSYFDIDSVTTSTQARGLKKLQIYKKHINTVREQNDDTQPEYSLCHAQNPAVHDTLDSVKKQFKGIQHLILIGIGGSDLGTKAIHSVLDTGKVKLHTLDTVSARNIELLLQELKAIGSVKKLAVCVISKSGNTTETLVNAGVLLTALEKKFKKAIYSQTIFIGSPGTDFMKLGKRLKTVSIEIPEIVGGRYSVATEVSLVPLALLGHDTDAFITGILDSAIDEFESVVAENAVRLHHYIEKSFRHYNFFAFEPRLAMLGAWYRQLTAESLGKETDRAGNLVTKGFVPTISTAVELHSVGQLYLSGFGNVYTDFVTFDDDSINYDIPMSGLAKTYGKFDVQEVATAIYGGVMGAYKERSLPYRSTIFDDDLPYALGLFMGMRMLETMYVAELLNLNAFNQPNVELYKNKTREILGI
ncbi:MAG: glucose-6-phosphate isomerase [Candidatus Paceibacteria bacterium]|jgi:glucose-6-phosphate isomerase